ncbi:phage portal protein [uncultured Clostridium sp.]|uniref:phage portal protein n=1 Tax=uncultured Clostridium sp. TaxID=59620 RepID=UPI0028E54FBF|nr:phage portal protein [uncultured Clostridium sp.]
MKICIDVDSAHVQKELITKIINIHKQELPRLQRLENYYIGKQEIENRILELDKPNNKLVTNYCSYITDTLIGFFMGSPVIYSSSNKEYLETLKRIFNLNDEQEVNIELARKQSIKGTGFEMVYIDEDNNIRFDVLDTDEVVMIYDTTIEAKPSMAIRYYNAHNYIEDKDITNVEVYTKTNAFYYTMDNNNLTLVDSKEHYFKEVPIIEYYNNIYRLGDFEKIISLQNNLNLTGSDLSNELSYFRDCYLKLIGLERTKDEDIAKMKENRVLLLDSDAKAEFMTKEINDSVIQNHLKNLKEDIHKVSYVPDLSQELPANLSGSAIKQKFFNTEQLIVSKERKFKKALQTRIRLITSILNLKGANYNWEDIEIKFNRNLPINNVELADAAIKLAGVTSRKTLLNYIAGYIGIDDVDKEMEQIEAENKTLDLDLIPEDRSDLNE